MTTLLIPSQARSPSVVPGDGGIVFPEAPGSFLASSQAGVVFWEAEERLSGSLLQFLYPCSFHAVLCSSPSQCSHGSSSCLLALLQTSSSPFAAAQTLLGSLDSLFSPFHFRNCSFFPPCRIADSRVLLDSCDICVCA